MTLLRSGNEVSISNSRLYRRHAPRASTKQRHQQLTNVARKTKPKAQGIGTQPRNALKKPDLTPRARNIRYARQARAYEKATGDSPHALHEKRRWLQAEFQADRILGKPFRELRDYYSKRNIGKPKSRRAKASDLTLAAQEAKHRLDEAFRQYPNGRPAAAAADDDDDGTLSAASDRAGNHSPANTHHPLSLSRDNDALARQRVIELGLELADYGVPRSETDSDGGNEDGEDEVRVKVEGGGGGAEE